MKSLQPQDLGLPARANADVQEINALKTLKNPAHRGTIGWFIDLIGDGLLRCRELATKKVLGKTVYQQTEHHNETQGNHPRWLLDEDGGSQEEGIFEEAQSTFHPTLLFIGGDDVFVSKVLLVQQVRGHNEPRFFPGKRG